MNGVDQEKHHSYALTHHIGLTSHVMKTMSFLMKTDSPNIWKQDDVVITKITFSHFMANIPVHILGNIIPKNKNVFLNIGT